MGDPKGEGEGTGGLGGQGCGHPWKIPSGNTCLLINSGTDPPGEAIGPLRSNGFLREVRTALCEKR